MRSYDAAATHAGLPLPALVDALRARFIEGCEVPLRHTHAISGPDGEQVGTLLLMPAWRPGGHLGLKTIQVFPGNGGLGLPGLHALYSLFDARTGVPLAQMDGMAITTRRTVAASALAADFLARDDARTLLVVGAGRLARLVPAALQAVRPGIDRVRVWNHRLASAEALVRSWNEEGLAAQVVDDLEAAVRQADIVSCVTLSATALVQGHWLRAGAHLDLVGAFTPTMREADAACFRRARVWVDTEEALAKAGDILQAIDEGAFDPARLQGTLAQLCQGACSGRSGADEITLFKSVGTALEDLAAAELLYDSAGPSGSNYSAAP